MPTGESHPNRNIAWAKSSSRTEAVGTGWLRLVDHSIDAAAVAEALLRRAGAVFCHGECWRMPSARQPGMVST